jgi:hypothetical protein
MGKGFDWRRTGIVTLAMIALFIALMAFLPLFATLRVPLRDLGPTGNAIVSLVGLVLYFGFFVLVFFGIPQFMLLMRFGVRNRWAYAFVGALAGWLLLFTIVESSVIAATTGPQSVVEYPVVAFLIALAAPHALLEAYLETVGAPLLVLFGIVGFGMSFFWPIHFHSAQDGRNAGRFVRVFLGKD